MKKLLRLLEALLPKAVGRLSLFLLFFSLGLSAGAPAAADTALHIPPTGIRVTDDTGTLSAEVKQRLSHRLEALEQQTGAQVAVLVVASLRGEPIEQYAMRVAQVWQPGRVGIDDGVILLHAVNDRKIRLEVGRGLEGVIPDITAKQITSTQMVPAFKAKQWEKGYSDAIDALEPLIVRAIAEREKPVAAVTAETAQVQQSQVTKAGSVTFLGGSPAIAGTVLAISGALALVIGGYRARKARLKRRADEARRQADILRKQDEAKRRQTERDALLRSLEHLRLERGTIDRALKEDAAAKARLQALREQIRSEDASRATGSGRFSSRTTSRGAMTPPPPPRSGSRSGSRKAAPAPHRKVAASSSTRRRTDDDDAGYAVHAMSYHSTSVASSSPSPSAPAPAPADFGGGGFSGGGASDSY